MTPPWGLVVADLGPVGWTEVGALARRAEEAGAASFWLTDHLYWHRPTVDPLLALHEVAAATTSILLGPCVLQMPLRDAASTAKALAFVHQAAPGRVVAGVGVGEHEHEFELAGHADRFARRGRLLDEAIDGLRRSWSAAEGSWTMAPGGAVPIWVGGRSDAARRRAARTGDGWIPHLCRLRWFQQQMGLLDADLAEAQRATREVVRGAAVAVHVDGVEPGVDPFAWLGRLYDRPGSDFERVLVRGTAAEVAAELHRFGEAGADHLALVVAGDQPVAHLEALMAAAA